MAEVLSLPPLAVLVFASGKHRRWRAPLGCLTFGFGAPDGHIAHMMRDGDFDDGAPLYREVTWDEHARPHIAGWEE